MFIQPLLEILDAPDLFLVVGDELHEEVGEGRAGELRVTGAGEVTVVNGFAGGREAEGGEGGVGFEGVVVGGWGGEGGLGDKPIRYWGGNRIGGGDERRRGACHYEGGGGYQLRVSVE